MLPSKWVHNIGHNLSTFCWQVNWGYNGNLYSFMFLRVALIPAIPHRITYCFWFLILARVSKFKCFHLAFRLLLAPTPQARKPTWVYCQLPSVSIPIMHSETRKMTYWSHCEKNFEPRYYLSPASALSQGSHDDVFVPCIRVIRPCIKLPLKVLNIVFSPVNACYLEKWSYVPKKEDWKNHTVNIAQAFQNHSSRGPSVFLNLWVPGLRIGSGLEIGKRSQLYCGCHKPSVSALMIIFIIDIRQYSCWLSIYLDPRITMFY